MNLKLWRSIYSYNGEFPGSLSFKENEFFLVLRKENDYWFLVSDKDGTLGCVPINYLNMVDISDKRLLKFIEKSVISLSQKSASVISRRDEIIKELIEYKSQNGDSNIVQNKVENEKNASIKPNPPSLIPDGLAFMLTDIIRQSTKASHRCSVRTLQFLLEALKVNIPDLKMWTGAIVNQIENTSEFHLEGAFHNSGDWSDLTDLFDFFKQRKNDSQERSWSLHEDVNDLKNKFVSLLKILKACNHKLAISFLETYNYDPFLSLIELYQMEQRIVLRQLLLQIFIVCCEISQKSINICLQSILPLELVRDLMDANINYKNFTYATLLLTILINGCNSMDIDLQDKLNVNFAAIMLHKLSEFHNTILNSSISDEKDGQYDISDRYDEECREMFHFKNPIYLDDVIIGFLLTLNKRFKDIKINPVITSLQMKPEYTRLFIEKLIRAFNRDYDPALVTSYIDDSDLLDERIKSESSSVRKILCDIYSSKNLAELVYRNDEDVLIDIISRELSNLPTNSTVLSEYLMLLDLIVLNSDYLERGKYKSYDIKSALNVLKTDDVTELDKILADSILKKLDQTVI